MPNFPKEVKNRRITVSADADGNFLDIETIDFGGCEVIMNTTFLGSKKLRSVRNMNLLYSVDKLFEGCSNLSEAYISGLSNDISFEDCPLSEDSIQFISDNAKCVNERTIKFNENSCRYEGYNQAAYNLMGKGWSVTPKPEDDDEK